MVCFQTISTFCANASPYTYSKQQVLYELKAQPENFFDMRNAKRSERSPDFKHKFRQQTAIWLNSAPPDLLLLVNKWDSDEAENLNKASWHSTHNMNGRWVPCKAGFSSQNVVVSGSPVCLLVGCCQKISVCLYMSVNAYLLCNISTNACHGHITS